ncbi:MAG: GreA/GreB family elongation factor [Oligoflexus sp.]
MNKQELVDKIIRTLEEEIRIIQHSAEDAQEEARGNDSLSASQYDNRALEASRLADAQMKRVKESQRRLDSFKQMKLKSYDEGQAIGPAALVEVLHDGETLLFFIGQQGAGTTIEFEGKMIELITPQSPLGDALIDQIAGDTVVVETPKGELEYEIIRVS